MFPDEISYTLDARLAVPGVEVAVCTFRRPEPFTAPFEVRAHTLSMSLTPQVRYSQGAYVSEGGAPISWSEVGDVTFAPSGTTLMVKAPGGVPAYRGLYCVFEKGVFEEMTGLGDQWSDEQLVAALDVQAPMIKRDLYRILKEVSEGADRREKLVEMVARTVLVELARYLRAASIQAAPGPRLALARWQMRRITEYVEGMIDRSPTVDELARVCEIGRRQLTRAFKVATGRTIGEYVTEARMVKAKSLLIETGLSQKEIAYRLGFSGPSSFCVAFGKSVGTTPKQFRSENK